MKGGAASEAKLKKSENEGKKSERKKVVSSSFFFLVLSFHCLMLSQQSSKKSWEQKTQRGFFSNAIKYAKDNKLKLTHKLIFLTSHFRSRNSLSCRKVSGSTYDAAKRCGFNNYTLGLKRCR